MRTIVLSALATMASWGLASGIAWRWLVADAVARRKGKRPSIRSLLRATPIDARAVGAGLAFLPVLWGGAVAAYPLLGCQSKLVLDLPHLPWPWSTWPTCVLYPAAAVIALSLLLGGLYAWAGRHAMTAAWARPFLVHLGVGLGAGFPAMALGLELSAGSMSPASPDLVLGTVTLAAVAPVLGALAALPGWIRRMAPEPAASEPVRASWRTWSLWLLLMLGWTAVGVRIERAVTSPFLEGRERWLAEEGIQAQDGPHPTSVPLTDFSSSHLTGCSGSNWLWWISVDSRVLAWCEGRDGDGATVLSLAVAPSPDRLEVRRSLRLAGPIRELRAWRNGVALLADGRRVVAIDSDLARREAVLPGPGWSALAGDPRGGIFAARADGAGGVVVAHLGADLEATSAPVRLPLPRGTSMTSMAVQSGRAVLWAANDSTHLHDAALALDARLVPWTPPVMDRLLARYGGGWLLALVLAGALSFLAVALGLRAGRVHRRLRAARRKGMLWTGRIESASNAAALLRTDGGRALLVDLPRTSCIGLAAGELPQGPCVALGAVAGSPTRGPYRSAPDSIGGSDVVLVPGDSEGALTAASVLRARGAFRAAVLGCLASAVPLTVVMLL